MDSRKPEGCFGGLFTPKKNRAKKEEYYEEFEELEPESWEELSGEPI